MWNILAWIVVGGIAGWLASLVVRGAGMGIIMNIVIGIVGAILGGALLSFLLPGSFDFTGFNFVSLLVAFVGAIVLLLIYRAVAGTRGRTV
jgi:uncharacterized membrane protein YeaQ/YmgE (transglycosylase-associated protein family)